MRSDCRSKIIVEFRVMDFDQHPSDILKELNLNCEFWEKGQPFVLHSKKIGCINKENGFSIAGEQYDSVEESITCLLDKVYPLKDSLKKLCENYTAHLSCVIYYAADYIPSIHLNNNILSRLLELNAEIDFDLYCDH